MKAKYVSLVSITLALLISTLMIAACGNEPILGTWKSTSTSTLERFESNGTYTYTNSTFTELGYLQGQWEKYDSIPTVQADGKTWSVYIVVPANRTITGDGEPGGNKYKYNDSYGDYYNLVSGNEKVIVIGAGNVKNINDRNELGTFSDMKSVRN